MPAKKAMAFGCLPLGTLGTHQPVSHHDLTLQIPAYKRHLPASVFEPCPFSPDWRWPRDHSNRVLSAGGTAQVYW